jgi:hypothetical protein
MSKEKPTFEDALALLATNPSPSVLLGAQPLIYAGLKDLADRVAVLEHAKLEAEFRLTNLEDVSNKTVNTLAAVEAEHTENKKVIAAVQAAPNANAKKIDDLDKRVRTVEGAVGSSTYKNRLDQPAPLGITPGATPGVSPPFSKPGDVTGATITTPNPPAAHPVS